MSNQNLAAPGQLSTVPQFFLSYKLDLCKFQVLPSEIPNKPFHLGENRVSPSASSADAICLISRSDDQVDQRDNLD
jgi:hypothetical protein